MCRPCRETCWQVASSCMASAKAHGEGAGKVVTQASNKVCLKPYVFFLLRLVTLAILPIKRIVLICCLCFCFCISASRRTIRRRNHNFCRDATVKQEVLEIFARHGIDARQIRLLWMVPAGADVLHVLEINDPSPASSSQNIPGLNLSERFVHQLLLFFSLFFSSLSFSSDLFLSVLVLTFLSFFFFLIIFAGSCVSLLFLMLIATQERNGGG